jgi:hypothetical protein
MGDRRRTYASAVPLTREQLGALIRLQGAAEEIQTSVRAVPGDHHVQIGAIGEQLRALISEVAGVITHDESLSAEFGRVVTVEPEIFWRNVEPRASALVGWLRGAVQAESLQMRIEAEARAYADARVQAERPVGFGA